jgi:hypothetical protein
MRKTTVYLNDEEAEALRVLSAATGVSQAELIRAAIRRAVATSRQRQFHSLGRGRGPGGPTPSWTPEQVYDKAFGRA